MNVYDVIKKPLITEKATERKESQSQYLFEIDANATKVDIRKAIQEMFNVKVVDVRVMNVRGKSGRNPKTGRSTHVEHWKKAYVTLKKGEKIEFFEGV